MVCRIACLKSFIYPVVKVWQDFWDCESWVLERYLLQLSLDSQIVKRLDSLLTPILIRFSKKDRRMIFLSRWIFNAILSFFHRISLATLRGDVDGILCRLTVTRYYCKKNWQYLRIEALSCMTLDFEGLGKNNIILFRNVLHYIISIFVE